MAPLYKMQQKMEMYQLRDSLKEKIAHALTVLSIEQEALRKELEVELDNLKNEDWSSTDEAFKAIATDQLQTNFSKLSKIIKENPLRVLMNEAPLLSIVQLRAIFYASFLNAAEHSSDYLAKVFKAVNNDEATFNELLLIMYQLWLKQGISDRKYPFDDVAVLLPIRIETLFDAPASEMNEDPISWKLSIRVIPDEASICRLDRFISKDEEKAMATFWESIRQSGAMNQTWLETDEAAIAWNLLSTKVRPERAAWLVAEIDIDFKDDGVAVVLPVGMPDDTEPNRVEGFPEEMKIYAVTDSTNSGADHLEIGRLPMDPNKKINKDELTLPLMDDLENQKNSWWASWEKAKAVGLGGEYMLPQGVNPENISALYVTGLSDEKPTELFADQINSGELSIARLGTPTNSIHGKDTGTEANWLKIATSRLEIRLNPSSTLENTGSRIQKHLTGEANALPFFPGSDGPDDTIKSKQLVNALWPALWGNWMQSIWGMGDSTYRTALWMMENLYPEGPLMPLRISDQPYGLLPVTSLALWEFPKPKDPEAAAQQSEERQMVTILNKLLPFWERVARKKGTAVGKTTEEFMQILGLDANSEKYLFRNLQYLLSSTAIYGLNLEQQEQFRSIAHSFYGSAIEIMGREPQEIFIAAGIANTSKLPLVQSTHTLFKRGEQEKRPAYLKDLVYSLISHFNKETPLDSYTLERIFTEKGAFGSLPDSLLIRLLVYACQTSTVWKQRDPQNLKLQEALKPHQEQLVWIADELDQEAKIEKDLDTASGKTFFKAILPDVARKGWERAFCATLDSAAHRIDPWITGFAWQRLKQNSNSERHHHRLGVYGWVDGPFIGKPGPTESGLLHTPSYNQTLATLIMRDKFLSSDRKSIVNERGVNPWQMDIDSQKVRLAEEIADEVRMGFHIYEILGRHIENIIGTPLKIRALRSNPEYSMRTERNDVKEVCDGIKTLPKLLQGDPNFPLTPSQQKALMLLKDSLDTYSDLLTGDGIMQIVTRQTGKASATIDAASGFSKPPSFEFIQTPPSGYHLETIVLSALPFVSIESLNGNAHPIRLADPSVAAFLEKTFGNDWAWTAINEDDQKIVDTVTLPMLHMSAIDSLAVSDDFLRDLVRYKLGFSLIYISETSNRVWEAFDKHNKHLGSLTLAQLNVDTEKLSSESELNDLIFNKLELPTDAVLKEVVPKDLRLWVVRDENQELIGLVDKLNLGRIPKDQEKLHKKIRQFLGVPKLRIDAPREFLLARQLIANLGSRPASGRDFSKNNQAGVIDSNVYSELVIRYESLYNSCGQFIAKLNAADDDAKRSSLLREALPWGVVPATSHADRVTLMSALTELDLPIFATPLSAIVKNAAEVLTKRLEEAVKPEDLISLNDIAFPLKNQLELKKSNIPDGVPSLAKAISNLASPSANLIILACWEKKDFIENTNLAVEHQEEIEEEWLTVIAAVRSNLARLEALQLELPTPMVSWTNSPGDPWRSADDNIVKKNLEIRKTKSVTELEMNRFVAAYGQQETWQGEKIATGLIDAFNEAIPMPERKTSVAFGFNAPAARAQQAILLAVAPKIRQRLDNNLLLKILEETRSLAHARNAKMEDLGKMQSLTPTMWFQGSGIPSVRLESFPLFDY